MWLLKEWLQKTWIMVQKSHFRVNYAFKFKMFFPVPYILDISAWTRVLILALSFKWAPLGPLSGSFCPCRAIVANQHVDLRRWSGQLNLWLLEQRRLRGVQGLEHYSGRFAPRHCLILIDKRPSALNPPTSPQPTENTRRRILHLHITLD